MHVLNHHLLPLSHWTQPFGCRCHCVQCRGRSRAAVACHRRGRRSAGRRRANDTSHTDRESARSARSPASGSSFSRGDPIRRGIHVRRGNPGYSTNNPVVRRTRLPLICTKSHQSLNTNPCIIGVLLLINILLSAITSSVVHFVNDIGNLTCTFVLQTMHQSFELTAC